MHVSFDPHDELGVPGHASQREIRDAYRRLAAQWHPDRNTSPSAAERMARINRAYRHLCDTGHAPRGAAEPEPESPPGPQPQAAPEAPRANRSWWNRDWSRARWEPDGSALPKTLKHEALIRLEDAAFGCRHRVKGTIADLCTTCQGVGRLVSRRSDCRIECDARFSGDDAPFDELPDDDRHPPMDDDLTGDEQRQRDQEPRLKVEIEEKRHVRSSRHPPPDRTEHEQWQPRDGGDDEHAPLRQFQ